MYTASCDGLMLISNALVKFSLNKITYSYKIFCNKCNFRLSVGSHAREPEICTLSNHCWMFDTKDDEN